MKDEKPKSLWGTRVSDEEKAKIIELWQSGHSASVIGAMLGRTRNSVIGYVHRLRDKGLITREASIKIIGATKLTAPPERKREKPYKLKSARHLALVARQKGELPPTPPRLHRRTEEQAEIRALQIARRITLVPAPKDSRDNWVGFFERADDGCRYPTGENSLAYKFCNAIADRDSPYCAEHRDLCTTQRHGRPFIVRRVGA